MKIVGYEGSRRSAVCSWGAAAVITDNGSLVNAVFPGIANANKNNGEEELASFVRKGSIEKLEAAIEFDGLDKLGNGNHPMFVFDMPIDVFDRAPYAVQNHSWVLGIMASGKGTTRAYHVFKSHKMLSRWLYHLHAGKFILVPYAV